MKSLKLLFGKLSRSRKMRLIVGVTMGTTLLGYLVVTVVTETINLSEFRHNSAVTLAEVTLVTHQARGGQIDYQYTVDGRTYSSRGYTNPTRKTWSLTEGYTVPVHYIKSRAAESEIDIELHATSIAAQWFVIVLGLMAFPFAAWRELTGRTLTPTRRPNSTKLSD